MNIQPSNPGALPAQNPVAAPGAVQGANPAGPVAEASSAAVPSAQAASGAANRAEALINRVDNYASGLSDRLAEAIQSAPESDRPAFRGAVEQLQGNLGRIRDGIQDGSLRGDDLAQAVQGAVGNLQASLAENRSPVEEANEVSAEAAVEQSVQPTTNEAAAVSQGRFQNITQSIEGRLSALEAPGGANDEADLAIQAAQETFQSSIARIESSFFDNGDFDRNTFYGLFSASLGRLQQNLSDIFTGSEKADATIYDPKNGVTSLSDGLQRVRFDQTA